MTISDMEKWLLGHSYQPMNKNWWQRCECHPSYLPMKTRSYSVFEDFAIHWEWKKGWKQERVVTYSEYHLDKNGDLVKNE